MRRLSIALAALVVLAAGCDESHQVAPPAKPKTSPRVPEQIHEFAARVPKGTTVALRDRPGGRVLAKVGARTEFGSPQTLALVAGRGDWAAVLSSELENSQVGWARVRQLQLVESPLVLDVDLSARRLRVHDLDGVVRRISIAIGAPETPTPPGDFYVTDKLAGPDFGPYYGCCILALSGRQPNLPQGWSGGDRLAIHGSPTPTWGKAVSNGCLHAEEADLRYLMRVVRLGTYVRVHA
jgi:lipoprotein-anchoring transpeptidase ErfK/SrfK